MGVVLCCLCALKLGGIGTNQLSDFVRNVLGLLKSPEKKVRKH